LVFRCVNAKGLNSRMGRYKVGDRFPPNPELRSADRLAGHPAVTGVGEHMTTGQHMTKAST
jgi:hypothetical protein